MWTYIEEQGRDGCVAVHVDHAQVVGEVTFSGAHEKQPSKDQEVKISDDNMRTRTRWCRSKGWSDSPRGRQDGGVQSAETGQRHRQGNGPVHHTKHLVCKGLEKTDRNVFRQNRHFL